MARQTCRQLTKIDLRIYGFVDISQDEAGNWHCMRLWYNAGKRNEGSENANMVLKEISITEAIGKHKYTTPKVYLKISFSYNNKIISIPLARAIYAWHNYEVPEGYDVEHIDNNPFNNNLDNLRLCTRSENLAKRFSDNPLNWTNQHGKTKGWKPEKKENAKE